MIRVAPFAVAFALSAVATQAQAQTAPSCAAETEDRFFARGVFQVPDQPWSFADRSYRIWFSRALAAMDEPSLWCGAPQADEAYRLLYIPSFSQPLAVRVTRTGAEYRLQAVMLSGPGGYKEGAVVKRIDKALTAVQWADLAAALEGLEFWSLPTATGVMGHDGAQVVIEGRTQRYHVVQRWDHDEAADPVMAFGERLLAHAGLEYTQRR